MFTDDQIAQLSAPLSASHVRKREQSGRKLSYIEGWHAIAEANRIFGFGEWSSETVELRMVSEKAREIGQSKAPGWGVSYVAKVRITIGELIREGTGAGHGIDRDLGQAHESAIKEAETDARKRALMTFGNPFGLALYDKDQTNVEAAPPPAKSQTVSSVPPGTPIPDEDKLREARKAYANIMQDVRAAQRRHEIDQIREKWYDEIRLIRDVNEMGYGTLNATLAGREAELPE